MSRVPEGATQLTPFSWYKRIAYLLAEHSQSVKSGYYDDPARTRSEIMNHWISGAFLALDLKTAILTFAATLTMPLDAIYYPSDEPAPKVNRVRAALDALNVDSPAIRGDEASKSLREIVLDAFKRFESLERFEALEASPEAPASLVSDLLAVFKSAVEKGYELNIAFGEYLEEYSSAIRAQSNGDAGIMKGPNGVIVAAPSDDALSELTMEGLLVMVDAAKRAGCKVAAVNPDLATNAHIATLNLEGFSVVQSRVNPHPVVFSVS